MRQKRQKPLSKIRARQRSHAKARFQGRFQLDMNRDRLHEIEQRIKSGQAVRIASKHGKTNYFVEVEGRLIVVGYDHATQRVVTVLPDDYVAKLPSDQVTKARFKLLQSAHEYAIGDIVSGNARLLHEDNSVGYYEVQYDGLIFKVGYHRTQNRLVPYQKRRKGSSQEPAVGLTSQPVTEPWEILELDGATIENLRRQL